MHTSWLAFLALITPLAAQALPGDTLVATQLPAGNPATQLLAVDSVAGVWQACSRFASDTLPPLAVTFDGYDGAVVLAVANSSSTSLVLRLRLAGTAVVGERVLGLLPGQCSQLEVVDDAVCATTTGTSGGLYVMPRLGGTAVQVLAEPGAAALATWGPASTSVIMAWSGSAATGPGFGFYDLRANQWTLGPWQEPSLGARVVTGIGDLPTGLVREAVAFADGGCEAVVYGGPAPTPIACIPAIPTGGAAAMKAHSPGGFSMRGLGSAAWPFLYNLEVWGLMPNVTVLAGPLPGDPVDLAMVPLAATSFLMFGQSCGAPAPHLNSRAWPTLGNLQFAINLSGGAPTRLSAFVLGLSDALAAGGVPLPQPTPGGCLLRVSPDVLMLHLSDASGGAVQGLPIPNLPALAGLRLFGQWLQDAPLPFASSEGVALQLGP